MPAAPSSRIARILKDDEVAVRLNMHVSTFRSKRGALIKEGFPPYDDLLRGTDGKALESWLDDRAGIVSREMTAAQQAFEEFKLSRAR